MLRSALLNVMIKAAQKASRALKRDFGEIEHLQVSLKGPADFVTAADRRAEETLREELEQARPGYSFLGEEGGRHEGTDRTHCWIVDPLDGTLNFLHGIPHFAISIALEREGAIVAGVVYNPATMSYSPPSAARAPFSMIAGYGWRRASGSPTRLSPAPYRTPAAATSCWHATSTSRCRKRSPDCDGSERPRSTLPGWPPAVSTPIGSATSRRGTWRPGSPCARGRRLCHRHRWRRYRSHLGRHRRRQRGHPPATWCARSTRPAARRATHAVAR